MSIVISHRILTGSTLTRRSQIVAIKMDLGTLVFQLVLKFSTPKSELDEATPENVGKSIHGASSPLHSLSHNLDRASLEVMSSYDSAVEARRRVMRASQQTGGRRELLFRNTIPLQLLTTSHPKDILHMSIGSGKENSVHLLAISNHNLVQTGSLSTIDVYQFSKTEKKFRKIHTFREVYPCELEHVVIRQGGRNVHLLAIAGHTSTVAATSPSLATRVIIYEIISSSNSEISFREFQKFPSVSVDSMKSITEHNTTYLVFGMRLGQGITAGHSSSPGQILILVYNPAIKAFRFHTTMPASVVSDIELYHVQGMLFMAVMYHHDKAGNMKLKSPIYKLNEKTKLFELYQWIDTRGARDIEHFDLTNGHYIAIANEASGKISSKTYGVPSTVYQFVAGKYKLVQYLQTYGVVRWKSVAIPNCQNNVLLFYADRRNNADQVGFYMFSHGDRKFSKIPLTFYKSATSTFRPRPNTVTPFLVNTDLYVAVGATDYTFGKTIYRVDYTTVVQGSPWEQFAQNVADSLKTLGTNLLFIEQGVKDLEKKLGKIVYTDTEQNIIGQNVFVNDVVVKEVDIESLDVSNGSIYYKDGNGTLHTADPTKYDIHDVSQLEKEAILHDGRMDRINKSSEVVLIIGAANNVTESHRLSNVEFTSKHVTIDNLVSTTCTINKIDICHFFDDIVFNGTDDVIVGKKTFTNEQNFGKNLEIDGRVNGVKVADEVVTVNQDQTILSDKMFGSGTNFASVNITGLINGVDLSTEALMVKRNETVTGMKDFVSNVFGNITEIGGLLDNTDVTVLEKDAMLINGDQNVTAPKEFRSDVNSLDNVTVSGLVNGFGLQSLSESIAKLDITKPIELNGNVVFENEVVVAGDLNVTGKLNNIEFPSEAVMANLMQNITGIKAFLGNVTVDGDIEVRGFVGGSNISKLVTLSGIEAITGKKTFTRDVAVLQNITISPHKLVDEVDISELGKSIMKVSDKHITSLSSISNVEFQNLQILGSTNNHTLDDYKQLFHNAMLIQGDQIVHGKISCLNNITVAKNIAIRGLVNGYSIPKDFLDKSSDQIVESEFHFSNISFQGDVLLNGAIDGIDINDLSRRIITTDLEQDINGAKTFHDDVRIAGNLTVCCSLNDVLLSSLLTKDTKQTVTAEKHFQKVAITDNLAIIFNNVSVEKTVNGVDLSNLTEKVHFCNKITKYVNKRFQFESVSIPGSLSVHSVNGIDLDELTNGVVLLNEDQVITSAKRFTHVAVTEDVITNSTVDGFNVPLLESSIVKVSEGGVISGMKTFQEIRIDEDLTVNGLVQNVNTTELADQVVLRTQNHSISGAKTVTGDVKFSKDIKAGTLNGLDIPRDVVLKSSPQNISGFKYFMQDVHVNGDLNLRGGVNGADVSELDQSAVKRSLVQTIKGLKIINNDMYSKGNVTLSGTIDGVDLSQLERRLIRINKNRELYGNVTFDGEAMFEENLHVKGRINGYNSTKIFQDAVLIDKTQVVTGAKRFMKSFAVQQGLTVNDDVIVSGLANNVNITQLAEEVVDLFSDQTITGRKAFTGNANFNRVTATQLNGRNTLDFVTVKGNETVEGRKIFASSLKATDDVIVGGTIDGEDVVKLARDTLFRSENRTQTVTGRKTFTDSLIYHSDVEIEKRLDGVAMKDKQFVTLNTEQHITGETTFNEGVLLKQDLRNGGLISDVNITKLDMERITLGTQQIIHGNFTTDSDVVVLGNTSVSGTTNGHDLSQYQRYIKQFTLHSWKHGKIVTESAKQICPALNYVKNNVLNGGLFRLDYFNDYQHFDFAINDMEIFKIESDTYLAATTIRTNGEQCSPNVIMKYSNNLKKFVPHHRIGASGGSKFKSFQADGELYLFLGNRGDRCLPAGHSILYKWNRTASVFHEIQKIPTDVVTDADTVAISNKTLLLAVANADNKSNNSSVTIWRLLSNQTNGATHFYSIQSIPLQMPTAVKMFEIEANLYMAVSVSYDPVLQSTKALSRIYKLNKLTTQWELLQKVSSSYASDVTFFKGGVHYFVAFANQRSITQQTQTSQVMGVEIYQFSTSLGLFVLSSSIPELLSYSLQPFTFNMHRYMSMAIKGLGVKVFMFRPHIGYELIQFIPQMGIKHHTVFTIHNIDGHNHSDVYLALSSTVEHRNDRDSKELFPRIIKAQFAGVHSSNLRGCT
eukprot:gene19940-21893_t